MEVGELAVANLEHVLKFKDNHALANDWIVTMCRRVLNLCWGFKQGRKKQHRWAVELLVPEEATQRKDEVDRKKSPEKKRLQQQKINHRLQQQKRNHRL